jgi:hypothetical protein
MDRRLCRLAFVFGILLAASHCQSGPSPQISMLPPFLVDVAVNVFQRFDHRLKRFSLRKGTLSRSMGNMQR